MPIVESESFNVVLDPAEVADVGRVQLFLNDGPIMIMGEGVDWGDAQIQAYLADQQVGSSAVDYRLPNRTVTIPLVLGGDGDIAGFEEARGWLQQKVALFQREGGWLKRGDVGLYADVVYATLHKPDRYGEAGAVEPDVNLVLECQPDFYGDEVTLDPWTKDGFSTPVLLKDGVAAVVAGDHPGRCRIVLTEGEGFRQKGVIWGFRSRYYDPASTAALAYDTTDMTPINGATSATIAGAYAATAITVTPAANLWHPFLVTDLLVGGQLTHQGSYSIWARCTTNTAGMQLRLLWSLDDTTSPVFNDTVTLPTAGYGTTYTLEHLGNIVVPAPPTGTHWWRGVIQAFATGSSQNVAIDEIFIVPLDEASGVSRASASPPSFAMADSGVPSAAANDAGVGTVAWSNPTGVFQEDASYASVSLAPSAQSQYLTSTGYGMAVPVGATVTGITVQVAYQVGTLTGPVVGNLTAKLMKAGVVQGASTPASYSPQTYGGDQVAVFGGPDDLWGLTWSVADVTNAGFGAAVTFVNYTNQTVSENVNSFLIIVYFTAGGGFTVTPDAVINASRLAEVRTEGVFREDTTSTAYVPVGDNRGDLPRIPPSGMEARRVQLLVKPSRGDLQDQADNGRDTFTLQVIYRPSYLFPA